MKLRYPWMIEAHVDAAAWGVIPNGYVQVRRELERATVWWAPRRLAWLYRYLPQEACWRGWRYEAQYPPYFLWRVAGPAWSIAWLPARRDNLGEAVDRYHRYGARWGVLFLGEHTLIL